MAEFNEIPRDYSINTLYQLTHSNVSTIPRVAFFNIMQNTGPVWDIPVQLSIVAQGLEQVFDRLVTRSEILSELSTILFGSTKLGVERLRERYETLRDKLNVVLREPEELKVRVLFQLFERTSLYTFDKEHVTEILQTAIQFYQQLEQQVRSGVPGHYIKLIMPSSSFTILSSEIGFPVFLINQKPILLSVRVRDIRVQTPTSSRRSSTFGVEIQPTLQLDVRSDTLRLNIQPKLTKIFYHKTDAYTFVQKSDLVLPPEEPYLGDAVPIRTLPIPLKVRILTLYVLPIPLKVRILTLYALPIPVKVRILTLYALPIPLKYDERYGQEIFGLGIRVRGEAETIWSDLPFYVSQEKGYLAGLLEAFNNLDNTHRQLVVSIEPDNRTPVYEYAITFQYKRTEEKLRVQKEHSIYSQVREEDPIYSQVREEDPIYSQVREEDPIYSQVRKEDPVYRQTWREDPLHHQIRRKKPLYNQRREEDPLYRETRNEDPLYRETRNEDPLYRETRNEDPLYRETRNEDPLYRETRNEDPFHYGLLEKTYSLFKAPFSFFKKNIDVDNSERITPKSSSSRVEKDTVTHSLRLTLEARGHIPLTNVLSIFYTRTLDSRTNWIKIHLQKTRHESYKSYPVEVCLNSVIQFPPTPYVFSFDTTATKDQRIFVDADLRWGHQCLTAENKNVVIKAVFEKSQEQLNVIQPRTAVRLDTTHFSGQWSLPWYYRQCQVDKQIGKSQSYACKLAVVNDSYLDKFTVEVNYEDIPLYLLNITQHLDLALKTYLYPRLQNNPVDVRNPDSKIRITGQFVRQLPGVTLLDLVIEKPTENTVFRKIYVPYLKPVSTLKPVVERHVSVITPEVEPVCSLMEKYITTLDNVTFLLPETSCQYLLSKDCSHEERYAVIVNPSRRERSLLVSISGQQIKLLPSLKQRSPVELVINGQTRTLTLGQPVKTGSQEFPVYIYLEETVSRPIVVLQAEREGLVIEYDGVNARVKVSPRYKGKHCGLCGDFNEESYREFVGPNLCVYTDSQDFVNSYALKDQQCHIPSQPIYPVVCPRTRQYYQEKPVQEESWFQRTHKERLVTEPRCVRNKVWIRYRENNICVSTEPVPVCKEDCIGSLETQELTRHFLCLPHDSPSVRELLEKVKSDTVGELVPNHMDKIEVAKTCHSLYP
ncbi:uncharacterized protein LOC143233745 [Tachypleus tridentatus]|uniref:uncharacterized protein LOC143233745 n=1 Tax=Tachypleus tridentatus TaxID=6853 RepID=UPI003FCF382F